MVGTVFVVDYQGFLPELEPKELVIVGVDSNLVEHYLTRPAVSLDALTENARRQVRFVTNHIHGITWQSGFIDAKDALEAMVATLQDARLVYVKGLERARYIERELKYKSQAVVVDLDSYTPFLRHNNRPRRQEYRHCSYGSSKHVNLRCSLEQATRYRDILRTTLYTNPQLPPPLPPSMW